MREYHVQLVRSVRNVVTVPMTVLGGAESPRDIEQLIWRSGIIGAAAGSLSVFKGPHRAVLMVMGGA